MVCPLNYSTKLRIRNSIDADLYQCVAYYCERWNWLYCLFNTIGGFVVLVLSGSSFYGFALPVVEW